MGPVNKYRELYNVICDFRTEMNVEQLNQDTEANLNTSSSKVPGENAEPTELIQLMD